MLSSGIRKQRGNTAHRVCALSTSPRPIDVDSACESERPSLGSTGSVASETVTVATCSHSADAAFQRRGGGEEREWLYSLQRRSGGAGVLMEASQHGLMPLEDTDGDDSGPPDAALQELRDEVPLSSAVAGASTATDSEGSWAHAASSRNVETVGRWLARLRRHIAGNPTGLSVTWLGTSSGAPTLSRNTSSIALRIGAAAGERIMLVDCGEGTPYQLRELGLDAATVSHVFVTHHHGDHCFGLPHLMRARSLSFLRRQTPPEAFAIHGPPGTANIALQGALLSRPPFSSPPLDVTVIEWSLSRKPTLRRVSEHGVNFTIIQRPPDQAHPEFPGPVDVHQFAAIRPPGGAPRNVPDIPLYDGLTWTVWGSKGVRVQAAQLHHRVPCWGYVFTERAAETREEAEAGMHSRKVCLLGDTMDSRAIAPLARGADLLSHESTFLHSRRDKARVATHSTGRQAAQFAAALEVKQLVLTHFSGRYEGGREAPSVAEGDSGDDVQGLAMLRREAGDAAPGIPVACAFDGFTWRLPLAGGSDDAGGWRDGGGWVLRASMHGVNTAQRR